jgi:hypothetical protein
MRIVAVIIFSLMLGSANAQIGPVNPYYGSVGPAGQVIGPGGIARNGGAVSGSGPTGCTQGSLDFNTNCNTVYVGH